MQTVLEIGSGSYKLCKLGAFSEKFESSLGKNLIDLTKAKRLNPESIKVAIKNLDEKILPFLKARGVVSPEVLVFATAAIRLSMGRFMARPKLKIQWTGLDRQPSNI